jgi:hypothetical protein
MLQFDAPVSRPYDVALTKVLSMQHSCIESCQSGRPHSFLSTSSGQFELPRRDRRVRIVAAEMLFGVVELLL